MKLLVKVGGTLVDEPADRALLVAQLAALEQQHALVVVHGGGKQVTRFLEERGVKSQFVGGLRVSNDQVIDAVLQVIAGRVNKQIVAALRACGSRAVGVSGVDGALTEAEQLQPELGWVGKPVSSDGTLLTVLDAAGFLPVVACVAGDSGGRIYNVNADQMAVSCASGWQADKLIFLTDVPGVKDGQGEVIPSLTRRQALQLIADGVAHGGMQAKLEAALAGLAAGLDEVVIASGREPNICERLLSGASAGTRLFTDTLVNPEEL